MPVKQQQKPPEGGGAIFLLGPVLILISLYFLIGNGSDGVGCFWFICLPGWLWGAIMGAIGLFLTLGGVMEIVDSFRKSFKKKKKKYPRKPIKKR